MVVYVPIEKERKQLEAVIARAEWSSPPSALSGAEDNLFGIQIAKSLDVKKCYFLLVRDAKRRAKSLVS